MNLLQISDDLDLLESVLRIAAMGESKDVRPIGFSLRNKLEVLINGVPSFSRES